ncbi:serine hydrolase [Nocardia sp. BMG111209]|uniref:serine hydrolase domain-containing protein n=1 Tax=Nocardia sp. BMG111209 TaxID=1160137 RepID=UPI000365D718|nr:serine hydrolase [Nocardia sp. BMG111209]
MGRILGWLTAVSIISTAVAAPAVADPEPEVRCAVTSGRDLPRAAPEEAGFDSARLAGALALAGARNRLNVQIFRHGCLIGAGPLNDRTGDIAWNVWSVTKSVVSLIAGIAWDEGRLDLDAPIDRYLPPGLGDAAHRAITVENLLTETSGLRVAVVNEGITGIVPIEPNSAVQALGVPLDHPPGTTFAYSQRNVDLLSYVVELAIGEPLQRFAQRALFDPLGIGSGDYFWSRDRAGHTYGYAHLTIPPNDLAKLALLLGDDGRWGDARVVSGDYLALARRPSPANPCYGYLFWTGAGCVEMPAFLPPDSYEMSGLGMQNVFVIPSLDLTVMWTGAFGSRSVAGPIGVLGGSTELTHEFFRELFAAFREPPVPDPGPYAEPSRRVDPRSLFDPDMTLAIFGAGPDAYPGCDVLSCLDAPLAPPFAAVPPGCLIVACLGADPRTPGIR